VDALAGALARCRRSGNWRQEARKLILVYGDSPGHSILAPAPEGCDLHYRGASVEEECHLLHAAGIEIATVYAGPTGSALRRLLRTARKMVEHTASQYRRLASMPGWAWEEDTGFADGAAEALARPPVWMARGPAYGTEPQIHR
jgi:hypothetical protein